jgi:hypothetical protein
VKIIKLFQRDPVLAESWGLSGSLGSRVPGAVVKRLLSRPSLIGMAMQNPRPRLDDSFFEKLERYNRTPHLQRGGLPNSDDWEAVHQLRPDLGLLPDGDP